MARKRTKADPHIGYAQYGDISGGSRIATVADCRDCQAEVPVSASALEDIERWNRHLDRQGEKLIGRSEMALCPVCYEVDRRRRNEASQRNAELDARAFVRFRSDWESTDNPDVRAHLERDFLRGCHNRSFYADTIRTLIAKEQRGGRKKKSARASAKAAGL